MATGVKLMTVTAFTVIPRCRLKKIASSSYTKTDKQKGLGIIVQGERSRYFPLVRDPDSLHLQEFFDEIGFVTECMYGIDYAKLHPYMTDQNIYCIVIVLKGFRDPHFTNYLSRLLQSKSPGIPVIVMTDYVAYSLYLSSDMADETDLLLVMPFGPRTRGPNHGDKENNILDEFLEVARSNPFADITVIWTRMNALYDRPITTFKSSFKKKLYVL